MRFTLKLTCNNAAFGDGLMRAEIAHIVRQAEAQVEDGADSILLRDANGAKGGTASLDR